ncbi:MAG TPA: hypothetical protein VLY82_02145 [Nitrososphaerales archaeon]|nr:hypothetical protein [Nitrososphaerales archaeon]
MNTSALVAVALFAGALLLVFGLLYRIALKSYAKGELGADGIGILRWALVGQLAILTVLAMTAFFT